MLPIARRIIIAAASGGTTYCLSLIADAPLAWTLMLAVFLGGVVLVVQFLVDFETKLASALSDHDDNIKILDQSVNKSVELVESANRLLTAVDQSALDKARLAQLTGELARFEKCHEIIENLVIAEIESLVGLLRGIGDKSACHTGEDRDWLLALTQSATISILATSTVAVDGGAENFAGGFWKSELGRAYLEAQRAAVVRGVEIRRVFVLDDEAIRTGSEFAATIDAQRSAGIETTSIVVNTGDIKGLSATFRDFILFDETVSYESELGDEEDYPSAIISTHLRLEKELLKERKAVFEEFWTAGKKQEI